MFRVTNTRETGHAARKTASRKTGASPAFTLPGEAKPEAAAGAGTVATTEAVGALDSLLALQASGAGGGRQGADQGAHLLDLLDDLRLDVLSGAIPQARLRSIADAAASARGAAHEPGLSAVLNEIDLRARVELAKREGGI